MPPLRRVDFAFLWIVLLLSLAVAWSCVRGPLTAGIAAVATVVCVGVPLACWWRRR